MTINHVVTKLMHDKVLIPICIGENCHYIRLPDNMQLGNMEGIYNGWTNNYNWKKLVHEKDSNHYSELTGTLCPFCKEIYMGKK